jgi:exonuclease III
MKHFLIFSLFLFTNTLYSLEFKIASYNVENLFDMQYNGYEYDAYIPLKHNWTLSNFKKKLLNVSEVICEINADIIGLQEIENENVLKKLQKKLRNIGCIYPYFSISKSKKSTIQVALLSKIPIHSTKEIVVGYQWGQRNILKVKYFLNQKDFYIYVNHWKSKKSPESQRMVSAKALEKELKSLEKGSEYIILGDFNSDYLEYKNIEKQHNDTHGKTGINNILKTVVNDRLIGEMEMKWDGFHHYNLWLELTPFQRWSHNFFGKKQALDAMLLPPTLFNAKGIDYVNDSFSVLRFPYLFHKRGYINRWAYKNGRHQGKGYSDHLPIVASFTSKPYVFHKKQKIKRGEIAHLYDDTLSDSIYLKEVKVILRRGHHAIIKASKEGRGIFIYGADGLKEGWAYDILVHKVKNYKGLHEVIDFSIEYNYGKVMIDSLYKKSDFDVNDTFVINEVLTEIQGIYKEDRFYTQGNVYPIFFKNRIIKPKDGTSLKLHRVQVGYYNTLQLVIWDKKDFTYIEE